MIGYYAITRYYCNECDHRVRPFAARATCKNCGNTLRRQKISKEEKADILKDYANGEKVVAIAAKFKRDYRTVMRIARAAGVPHRAIGRRRNKSRE